MNKNILDEDFTKACKWGLPNCVCGGDPDKRDHRSMTFVERTAPKTDPAPAPSSRWPTLEAIGLGDALDAIEEIAAAHQGKHPGRKWITKTVAHHDAKAIKHLSTVQCGQSHDADSGLRGRAHAGLRLLMALGLELLGGR